MAEVKYKRIRIPKRIQWKEIIPIVLLGMVLLSLLVLVLGNPISSNVVSENPTKIRSNAADISFVIEIKNAEHLDQSRNLLGNIYEQLKAKDDIWSPEISDGEYVRVIFEEPLDSTKDITIFPRVVSGNPTIKVYEKDSSALIAEFTDLDSEKYNKVLLTNLRELQDTFDLRVIDGSIEFDHIYDPVEPLAVTACTAAGCSVTNYNDNTTSIAVTLGKNAIDDATIASTVNLGAADTINSVDLHFRWTNVVGLNGNWEVIPQSKDGLTNYCAAKTIAQTNANEDKYVVVDIMTSCVDTKAELDDLRLDIKNADAGGAASGDILYVNVTIDYAEAVDIFPNWSDPSVNDSTPDPSQLVSHNVNWTDDNAMSYATLEVNSSGASCDTTANVSSTTLSSASEWANLSWQIPNACEGKVISWKQYANDSSNQWNTTSAQTYTVNNIAPTASFGTNPIDNYNSTSQSVIFELSCSDNLGVDELQLYGDWTGSWTANQTNSSPVNATTWSVTVNDIPEGLGHVWGVWCNDTSINGNSDWSDTNRTFSVDTTGPSLSNEGNNETAINQTEYFCVNITATDALSGISVVYGEVWNTASWQNYTMTDTGSTSCDGGSGDDVYGVEIQANSQGIWNYSRAYANDSFGNWNNYDFSDLTVNVTAPPDSVYPQFSNFQEDLANNSAYSTGQPYIFNSTINNTNGTIFLSFGSANYSASNDSISNFYRNFASLAAGTYEYFWWGYGNGTNKNYNQSGTRTYVVQQNSGACGVSFNDTSPVTYPTTFRVLTDCTSAYTLSRNGTSISNNSEQILPASAYNFSVQRTDTQNYSNTFDQQEFRITKATPTGTLTNNETWTEIYPTPVTIGLSESNNGDNDVSYFVWRDGVNKSTGESVLLGVGTYNYTLNTTGGTNYTSNSSLDSQNLTINANSGLCSVYFNDTSPITYPKTFRVWTDCNSAYTLYRNGTSISNNSEQILPASAYNFSVQRTDNTNYSNTFDQQEFRITKATGEIATYIDNVRSNRSILLNNEKWLNATLVTGAGTISLYYNDTLINQGSSPLSNLTNFTGEGTWNVSGIYTGNENYTSDIETWWAIVSTDSPPTITIVYPGNTTYNTDVTQLNYIAEDDISVSGCWYSTDGGSTNSSFDTGCTNGTSLSSGEGSNTWTVWANDSIDQLGTSSVTFFKDTIKPSISSLTESPSDPTTYVLGQEYQFNATITDDNLNTVIIEFNGINYTPSNLAGDIYNLTITGLGVGDYNYTWYANDTANNVNTTSGSYTINQDTSSCNVAFNETSPITYPASFTVWSTCNSPSSIYRNGTAVSNNSLQQLAAGKYNFTVIRTDQNNYSNFYDEQNFTIDKGAGGSGITFVINGSDNQTAPYGTQTNASAYTIYPGTFTIYRNSTNVTSQNNVFVTLAANYYEYSAVYSGNENYTSAQANRYVLITKIPSEVNLTLNGTDGNVTIVQDSSIYLNFTALAGDPGATLKLYRGGSLIQQGTSPLNNLSTFNSIGNFNITGFYEESENYTGSFETWYVNVTEAPDLTNPSVSSLTESPTDPATYNLSNTYEFNATITDNRNLSIVLFEMNGTNYSVSNVSDVFTFSISNLSVGFYVYRWYANDTSGNWNSTESGNYTINQDSPSLSLVITPSTSESYGTETTATGSNCPSELTCTLYRDGIAVSNPDTQSLGVATYNYTYNTSGNANYTSASNTSNLTISQSSEACSVLFNESSPVSYGTSFTVYTDCTSNFTLYRNGTSISNNSVQSLAVSAYNFTVIRTDSQNYSNIYDEQTFIVQKATGVVFAYIDNSRANKTIEQFTEIYLNATLQNGTGTIQLYYNDSLINEGSSPLSNLTNLSTIGFYNVSAIYAGNANYTSDIETWYVNVSEADVVPPQVSLLYPANTSYSTNQTQLNYSASDNFELDACWYSLDQGATNITITCGQNVSGLNSGEGSSTWTIYANDTKGFENSSSVTFFVDSTLPAISFADTTETNDSILGRNFIRVNVTASDSNLDTISINLYDSTTLLRTNTSTSSPFSINYTGLSEGLYYFNATVNDTTSNEISTETRTVNLTTPILNITRPKNKTYVSQNLTLKFTASYYDFIWYNIDDGDNTTLTGNSTFNTSSGLHTLNLYANNTLGEVSDSITFTSNPALFVIHYDNFNGAGKGSSTNFNDSSFDELQNLSGIIIEDTSYGKIEFSENINVTNDSNSTDNEVDLDNNINVSDNFIDINSTALPNFNKSATLYLYNLTFSNPRVLRNGEVCPDSICTEVDYTGGTFIFTVTQFSNYSAEETPSDIVISPGGGGGPSVGGGVQCTENRDCEGDKACFNGQCVKLFDIKIINFESPVKLGDFFDFTYFLKGMSNINDDVTVDFWIENQGIMVTSGSDVIYLGDFEEKTETTKLYLPSNLDSGIYTFYVRVRYGSYEVSSHRTIEIAVEEGVAILGPIKGNAEKYVIFFLIALAIILLAVIFQIEKKKILRGLTLETRWVKRYRTSILTAALILIMIPIIYLLKLPNMLASFASNLFSWIGSNIAYLYTVLIVAAIVLLVIIFLQKLKKKGFLEEFSHRRRKRKALKKLKKKAVKEEKSFRFFSRFSREFENLMSGIAEGFMKMGRRTRRFFRGIPRTEDKKIAGLKRELRKDSRAISSRLSGVERELRRESRVKLFRVSLPRMSLPEVKLPRFNSGLRKAEEKMEKELLRKGKRMDHAILREGKKIGRSLEREEKGMRFKIELPQIKLPKFKLGKNVRGAGREIKRDTKEIERALENIERNTSKAVNQAFGKRARKDVVKGFKGAFAKKTYEVPYYEFMKEVRRVKRKIRSGEQITEVKVLKLQENSQKIIRELNRYLKKESELRKLRVRAEKRKLRNSPLAFENKIKKLGKRLRRYLRPKKEEKVTKEFFNEAKAKEMLDKYQKQKNLQAQNKGNLQQTFQPKTPNQKSKQELDQKLDKMDKKDKLKEKKRRERNVQNVKLIYEENEDKK